MDTPTFGFEGALALLKSKVGTKVARSGWNAHHFLELQVPDEHSKMSRPYIYMTVGADAANLQGARIPWVASHTDLMANDWYEVSNS